MVLPPRLSIPDIHISNKGWSVLAIQSAILLFITAVFTIYDWDRQVAGLFYQTGKGWYLDKQPLWRWLHAYGTIPGILLTLAALMAWIASFYVRRLKPWRRPCLVVVLTTILAAGLLVNAVLKQYWGRPRPSQTIEFGGKWEYRPIYPPGTPGKGASFPCGHCTMGFVFLAMAGFRRHSKALAYGGVTIGIVLGGLLSAARVVQGAHYLSDTIWSLGIVGMAATALLMYLPPPAVEKPDHRDKPISKGRRSLITLAAIVALLIIAGGFMTRRPYYKTMVYPMDISSSLRTIHIIINTEPESIAVQYANRQDSSLKVDAHGFGWMEFDYQMGFGTRAKADRLNITLHIEADSYFAELNHAVTIILPEKVKDKVKVYLNHQPI